VQQLFFVTFDAGLSSFTKDWFVLFLVNSIAVDVAEKLSKNVQKSTFSTTDCVILTVIGVGRIFSRGAILPTSGLREKHFSPKALRAKY